MAEDLLHAALTDALAEVDEVARVARETVLEERLAAEVLHAEVHHPGARKGLVSLVVHVLQQETAQHQPHRHRRLAGTGVER